MPAGQLPFVGVGVALVTLFTDDGDVDVQATVDHALRLVDLGVQAVLVAGSTGEAAALDAAERNVLLEAVVSALGGTVPILAGTGAASARQAVTLTMDAIGTGADGVVVLSPQATRDPRPYYAAVAEAAGDKPVLAYHFPTVSAPGIAVESLPDLPVAGCKDSSGDPERMLATLAAWDGALYVGSSALLTIGGALGCPGAILALANAVPERCREAFEGDAAAQQALTTAHLAARASFPSGIKGLTAARFGTSTASRMG